MELWSVLTCLGTLHDSSSNTNHDSIVWTCSQAHDCSSSSCAWFCTGHCPLQQAFCFPLAKAYVVPAGMYGSQVCSSGFSSKGDVLRSYLQMLKEKKRKNYIGSETTPYIDKGKGDTLARRAVSLLHQGEWRTSEDLEGDKPPPAPDQDLGVAFELPSGHPRCAAVYALLGCAMWVRALTSAVSLVLSCY